MLKEHTKIQAVPKVGYYPYLVSLLIPFLGLGMLMVIELGSASSTAPYYSAFLYGLTSVLGVTVGTLSAEYFLGEQLLDRFLTIQIHVLSLLVIGVFLTFLSPVFNLLSSQFLPLGAALTAFEYLTLALLFVVVVLLSISIPNISILSERHRELIYDDLSDETINYWQLKCFHKQLKKALGLPDDSGGLLCLICLFEGLFLLEASNHNINEKINIDNLKCERYDDQVH